MRRRRRSARSEYAEVTAKGAGAVKHAKTSIADPNVRAAETRLRRHFGTQVRIVQATGSAAGKIELEYYNQGDLDRIYGLLIGPKPMY